MSSAGAAALASAVRRAAWYLEEGDPERALKILRGADRPLVGLSGATGAWARKGRKSRTNLGRSEPLDGVCGPFDPQKALKA